jgi:hypothetical protein
VTVVIEFVVNVYALPFGFELVGVLVLFAFTGMQVVAQHHLLAQSEYLGCLTCPSLGPWLRVAATFFDANGLIVATGSDSETSPVAGVRYLVRVFGERSAVRAEAVASVACL